MDTIVAIASGVINQPIGIIRISGPDAFSIAASVLRGKVGKSWTVTHDFIINADGDLIDEVLVSWFRAPRTFTGFDTVEISAHGGQVNLQRILSLLLSAGARQALPGEFSRYAFLNGKMSLVKAEAIHDLIFAKTSAQAELAASKFDGHTTKMISDLIDKTDNIIGIIETNIDYPEYDDLATLTSQELLPQLKTIKDTLQDIITTSELAAPYYQGIRIAIIGKPNAGKSSLFNALIGHDKAIVTAEEGTTRDVVEEATYLGRLPIKLLDTAGVRQVTTKAEAIGVAKTWDTVKEADLVFHVVDAQVGFTAENETLMQQIKTLTSAHVITVYNKSDLMKSVDRINVSAMNNDLNELIEVVEGHFIKNDLNEDKIITNTRQIGLLRSALIATIEGIKALEIGEQPETVIVDIHHIRELLVEIIGQGASRDLLSSIFDKFCLGK